MTGLPLTGGAYTAHSLIAAAQRSVNLYAEPMPKGQLEPAPVAHYPTPGLRHLSTIGTGPIRGIRQATNGNVYVVSGNGVYSVNPTSWAGTHLGDITAGLITPVSMADNGLDLVIVDGTANGWKVTLADNTFGSVQQSSALTPATGAATEAITAGAARYTPFTPSLDGLVGSPTFSLGAGYTGKLKCSIFSDAGGAPGTVQGSANDIINPHTGSNTLKFAASVAVSKGTQYWLGFDSDTSSGSWSVATGTTGKSSTTAYKDFPAAAPVTSAAAAVACSLSISTDPDGMFAGADKVDYLDTYLLLNKPNTPQFYITGSLAVTFDTLDFANKETYSDLLVTICVAKREVYLLGERTTEIWYDAGATDTGAGSFAFAQVQGVFIDHGIVAKYSVANYDNALFWLSRDRQGQGIVLQAADYKTKRVSTYAIEASIAGYARIDDAIGYCYQLAGHAFYVLIFPHADKTWVYDITTELWHEWVWIDSNGDEHRHRSNCHWPVSGLNVVGDHANGNLYALDRRVFTDNGQPIKRVRSFPHLVADGKRLFFRSFIADIATGEGA